MWVAVATVVQLSRGSSTPVWDSLWAEDGRFFYGTARTQPLTHSLLKPLAGYVQVVPRGFAWVAAQFPTQDAALVCALLAALGCALLSLYTYLATDGVLARQWQRVAVAALLVVHPAAAFEVNAALNNLHWFFMIAAFWACCSTSAAPRRVVLAMIVVLLAALSDPLTGLLLPLVLYRAWRGVRVARWISGALVLALGVQYWLGFSVHPIRPHGSADLLDLPAVYGLRVAGSFLVGDQGLGSWWQPSSHRWPAYAALLIVAIVMGVSVWYARHHERRLLLLLLGYSVIFLVAPLATRGGASRYLHYPLSLNGSRYTIIPLYLLYCALVVAAGLPWRLPAVLRGWLLPGLAVALIGAQIVANFATAGPRTSSGSWRQAVAVGRAGCRAGGHDGLLPGPLPGIAQPRIYRGIVELPVAPWGRYFWAVRLTCKQLSS